MKFFFFLVVLALLGIFLAYRYQEAHPEKQGIFSYDLKEKEKESTITPPSVYRVLEANSADRFIVLRNNVETQNFHLVGLIGIPSDGKDVFECGKSAEELKALSAKGLAFAKDLVVGRSDLHVRERNREHKGETLLVEGDILLTNGVSLSELVIKNGYAKSDPDAVTDYEGFEKEARRKEKGVWSNSVPLKDRFKVSSSIRQKGLTRDSHAQQASMTKDILETVASEERCVTVDLDIFVKPPMTRSYELMVICDYGMDEIMGADEGGEKRVQKDTEHTKEILKLTTLTTNLSLRSSAFEMSKITKGGRTFRQGIFCSSCVLRVFLEGEEIHFDEGKF
ncbi:hypothetical protein J6X96_04850 [bacterium]|nr:hypothetical protein [bacterium]